MIWIILYSNPPLPFLSLYVCFSPLRNIHFIVSLYIFSLYYNKSSLSLFLFLLLMNQESIESILARKHTNPEETIKSIFDLKEALLTQTCLPGVNTTPTCF